MPSYPHIERYRVQLEELIQFGGSDSELNIRAAFQNCLADYCREHRERLALVPELRTLKGVIPDGTVKDTLRMARGYWEAKDSDDNLDAEILRKFNRGYPRDNILFEDSQTAVLIQNREEAMRVDMSRPGELHRLIRRFLDYELPQIEEFRDAQRQFKDDLPTVLDNLRGAIESAEADNSDYRAAAADFLELCRQSISPEVSEADVREMLLQHILTRDIFLRVFGEDQFHRENDIAQRLDTLEQTFFTGDVRREAIERLRSYYGAIGRAADEIADYAEKQGFLKAMYEDFYKAYNPAAADRLGVVYTPNEVVDFIIRGTDHLLQKHFGRSLADENVQILDPATGTGTFLTSLIDYLPADKLEYKYLNEIHANEVAILPYYIANLNIEYTYREKTGQYLAFPNLCFVDTLDNMNWQKTGATGGAVTRQGAFNLGGLSTENWMRVQLQNEKTISAIIGNPPYNDKQNNWYELNPNRKYPAVDQRIRDTYVKESNAQRTHQYDMYKRFIRWASDRLDDDGVIAFVTNRSYIDSRQDDGFRNVVADEFSDIYILDLGSDVRRNPKISGTTHNVFGIQTGVAIGFFVRDKSKLHKCSIHYMSREDSELAIDKLEYLHKTELEQISFEGIAPDARDQWLDQTDSGFEQLVPIANKETKTAKTSKEQQAVFRLYSNGINSNRDEWLFDFDRNTLSDKVQFFSDVYHKELQRFRREKPDLATLRDWLDKSIKWTSELETHLTRGSVIQFSTENLVSALYRPFVSKHNYYAPVITHRTYQQPRIFPFGGEKQNKIICFRGLGTSKLFSALATDRLVERQFLSNMQCLPMYSYSDDGERVCNITDWGIRHINDHYRKDWGKDFKEIYPDGISADEIFAYTYGVLHDPVYRHDYRADLMREFPRLPLYRDFDLWAKMGRELLDLHIGFESAEPYQLERHDKAPPVRSSEDSWMPRARLRADKERGVITLDEQTTLSGVPPEAWRYVLGSRSALEWVLDQYKEKKPRDPTIREKFNTYRFADYKEQVVDLLKRVCTVSVKTMEIVDSMAYWDGDKLVVFGDRDRDELATLAWSQLNSEPEDEEWMAAWSET